MFLSQQKTFNHLKLFVRASKLEARKEARSYHRSNPLSRRQAAEGAKWGNEYMSSSNMSASPTDVELEFPSGREPDSIRGAGHDLSEYRCMEQWLDEHPDFVHDYFARKATRSMVDGWLIAHALSQSTSSPSSGVGMLQSDSGSSGSSNSKHSSGANTPVRKISAQEFEKGGQILKPMVSTVDGQPSFLGPTAGSTQTTPKASRRTHSELKALDERELMYELVIDICNDLDVTSLCHKILQNVSILLNADRCSMFLVQGPKGSENRVLVSTLFDVNIHSTLQDCKEKSEEIRVSWGTGIIGYVAQTGIPVNIPDAYEVWNLFRYYFILVL